MFLTLCVSLFTSCDDDDDYVPQPVNISNGAYIFNEGNYYSQIPGSVTYIDYSTYSVSQNVFNSANGRVLGNTPNDAVMYGSKIYVAATDDHIVEVIDKSTMKSLYTLHTDQVMGTDKGTQPRCLVANEGKVYVSTYCGYVAAIDTTSYNITNTYQVGSYPEGMAVLNGTLYVANSDWGNGKNPSISQINLSTGAVTTLTNELITNPVSFAVVNGELYFLDSGLYDASYNQTGAGVRKISGSTVTKVIDATLMAAYGSKIYTCNAPYSYPAVTPTYSVYDTSTGSTTSLNITDIYSACSMAVDPVTGNLFITSYTEDPDTGYAGYSIDGYVNIYSNDGTFIRKCTTGVGPGTIVFNTGVKYE